LGPAAPPEIIAFVDSPEEIAERILASNTYMTLATADGSGVPWASPVYYAPSADRTELYRVSRPVTRHSRNLEARPELAIVIFDSTAAIYMGQAVYNAASGGIVPDEDLERGMNVFAERSREDGEEWTIADVQEPAELRLYRAVVGERWILDPDPDAGDNRVPVRLAG
jgi:nitroimidazol reductase NimA-like FMN-containing flavoprotein (pyridoxamine 5'-phosphate oxidase superfamily)